MAHEFGRGAQVQISGEALGAARGAMANTMEGNRLVKDAWQADPGAAVAIHPYAANDVEAAAAGVVIGGLYCNTAGLQQRQA